MINRFYIIFFIIFSGCAITPVKMNKPKPHKIQIDTIVYSTNTDSKKVNLLIKVPYKNLVFKKEELQFSANLNYTIHVNEKDSEKLIRRISKSHNILLKYYEDTRNPAKFFEIEEELILPIIEDQYKISVIVEDDDSHRVMKESKVVDVMEDSSKSDIRLYSFIDGEKIHIQKKLNSEIDSLWMVFQFEQLNNKSDIFNIEVKVLSDSSFIDTTQYELILNDEQIYNISYKINQEWEGKYTFFIGANGQYLTKEILIPNKSETRLWSEKKSELLGVMLYVLSHEESKHIYDMNLTDLKTYIQNYWQQRDPTPTTKHNELLEEFNFRVHYANENYSIMNNGWKSDMGKIHIIYGPPETIDRHYNAEQSYTVIVWYYGSGRRFTFSDRRTFGEFNLVSGF